MTEENKSQSEMPKAFDPQAVEAGWYARWEADALFVADPNSDKPKFTMDSKYVRSVMTAFVAFYDRGWIYRAPRIVNWCPHDRSAISDLEIEWEEHQDTLYFIRYPVENDGDVVIATVRPETMLADTG